MSSLSTHDKVARTSVPIATDQHAPSRMLRRGAKCNCLKISEKRECYMGGFGSGRRGGYGRLATEKCRVLDVNLLHRKGCLRPGWRGAVRWNHHANEVARVLLLAEADRVVLSFRRGAKDVVE